MGFFESLQGQVILGLALIFLAALSLLLGAGFIQAVRVVVAKREGGLKEVNGLLARDGLVPLRLRRH